MIDRRIFFWGSVFVAALLVAGCADLKRPDELKHQHIAEWNGRLSVRTLGQTAPAAEAPAAFQAAFELHGNAQQGELLFFTPLGSAAASIRWNAAGARLLAGGETRQFGDLQQLVHQAVGTELPIAALFGWLQGQPQPADGWQVDLSRFAQGKITARRNSPPPVTELRLVLDSAP